MKNKLFLLAIIAFFVLDRLLKITANSLSSHQEFFIIPKIFKFTFWINKNAAFSLPLPAILIILLSLTIILALIFFLWQSWRKKQFDACLGLALIVSGAASNLWDRLVWGGAIDYLHLRPISFFNLADLMIGAGVIIIIYAFQSPFRSRTRP